MTGCEILRCPFYIDGKCTERDSKLRPEVARFAEEMEKQLR